MNTFKKLGTTIDRAELEYERVWLKLLDYNGINPDDVKALDKALQVAYKTLEDSRAIFNKAYYAL